VLLTLVLALGLSGCGDTPGDVLPDARDGRSGVQLSGTINGRQTAFSDGLPTLNFGDCDIPSGPDRDFCIVTRDINGELIVIVFENPAALVEGADLPVGDPDCGDPRDCDEVTDMAIIDFQVADGRRVRAQSGSLQIDVAEPSQRYRGTFDIRLPDNSAVNATFDVVPRPEELSAIGHSAG
jgi:uncharacterized ubiquitin-like protein YukD